MGHQNRHFSGDTFANAGFWSPPTSAANCEEDYAVTRFIAEFINCISSFAYVLFALMGRGRPGHQKRFDALSVALVLVGLCSAAFHGTLRQGAQFSDDLSMLLLGACLLQRLYTYGQTPAVASLVNGIVVVFTLIATVVYVRSGDIIIHLVAFSIQVHSIWPRTIYLIYFAPEENRGKSSRDTAWMARRFWTSVLALLSAFVLWNIDLERCFELRAIRDSVGLPWAWALEFHGWWHVLTAFGAIEYILLVRRLCEV